MQYTGDVVSGGPPAIRVTPALTIGKLAVGPMDNNAYLLRCNSTGEQLLIDAAADAAALLRFAHGKLAAIITTHRHRDHWGALAELTACTGARTYAGELDVAAIPVPATAALRDGDLVRVGVVPLLVRHLPGHTPGSIVVIYAEPGGRAHLFTGDCLFPGGVGRTSSPAEFATLYEGVSSVLFAGYPDDAWVYPGHGADTTLGAQRPQLSQWRERGW